LTTAFFNKLGNPNLLKLNADEVTAMFRASDPMTAQSVLNLRAAQLIDAQVADCITTGRSFLVETVLSSDKYRDDLELAKQSGFKTGLIYVSLYPPELSPSRVKERVALGGHTVDHDTAIKRYHKSHEQLSWFAENVDTLTAYDNSVVGKEPVLIAQFSRQPVRIKVNETNADLNPVVWRALGLVLTLVHNEWVAAGAPRS
jgi:predicted ABC-type ATPase